jgi:hypothetical protein
MRESNKTELYYEDLEKLPVDEVARIAEWLTEKVRRARCNAQRSTAAGRSTWQQACELVPTSSALLRCCVER